MIQIGNIKITLINDARILTDAGGVFGLVPRALFSPYILPDDQNRLPMDQNCLFVEAGGKRIIVETGYGLKLQDKQIARLSLEKPEGGLVNGLAKYGIRPVDIDIVINTHLHADHCSGNTFYEGDALKPTFSRAEYLVQRLEYADAAFPNERTRGTYFAENFKPLYEGGQMKLIDGEVEVVPGVRCVITPGHTRAHQSVVFESGGKAAIFVSDLASWSLHFANLAWMTGYDTEPLVTLETKRVWQKWALEHDALLLFTHDPITPVGRLTRDGDRLKVVAATFKP